MIKSLRQYRWEEVAVAFDTPEERNTERQQALTRYGLCAAMFAVTGSMDHYDLLSEMGPAGARNDFWFPVRSKLMSVQLFENWKYSPIFNSYRATFASLMSVLTDDERDDLLPGL